MISSNKGINLPGVKVSSPTLTAKDRENLEWGIEVGVDYVALSFVRHPDDIRELKEILRSSNSDIAVIAKIEKPEAVRHIEAIVEESDAIMVARGDLGVEMHVEEVPHIQKEIIAICARLNKPVIVATQMLESMIENATPTRAEVSDVANAIMDGTDVIMLSGETSAGKYPLRTLSTMVRIAERTEEEMSASAAFERRLSVAPSEEFGNVIATAVAQMVQRLSLQLVIGFTASGKSARLLSKRRLPVPIMGASNSDRTLKKMCLYRGVVPVNIEIFEQGEEMFRRGQELAVENGLAKDGDTIVFVAGIPLETGATNTLRLHRINLGRDR
jgi:pyruvate kinase